MSRGLGDVYKRQQPHPHFDYEKKVFTKDGREEYAKELKNENSTKKQV